MPRTLMPSSYEQAAKLLDAKSEVAITRLETVHLRSLAEGIAVIADSIPFITFFRDGRIKLCTLGRNDRYAVSRLNSCLPHPYFARVNGSHVSLCDRRKPAEPIANFLSSTIFIPDPAAPSSKRVA